MSGADPVKVVVNAGAEPFELDQVEQGALVAYTLAPGEQRELPLDDAELAELAEREKATASAPLPLPPPPDGVIGWACTQLVGATCTHDACRPADVTAAAESQAAALAAVAPAG